MNAFIKVHEEQLLGKLTMFDRMIFRGHLNKLYFGEGAFEVFLWRQGVPLKDFGPYVKAATLGLKAHAQQAAAAAGRPYLYLAGASTKASGHSKEELARQIAARDGITEGLICVLATLEPCSSFEVRADHESQRLRVVHAFRKCLHFYYYLMDREFGFMHVRLQSWFPLQIQLYINGREWLARQLDKRGIAYERYENSFRSITDVEQAERMAERMAHRKWPRVLDAFARMVNPLLPSIREACFGGYYWVLEQAEIATDLMFRDRESLGRIMPELFDHALRSFSAEDVMRFLGRKLQGNFQGELTTDDKRRPEGRRVKHRMKRNSLKMYDKYSVLRVETTINNPREFKVLRRPSGPEQSEWRWMPMGKGVANTWRYFQIGAQANLRYLEALGRVTVKGDVIQELDRVCRSVLKDGKRHARLNPLSQKEIALFRAVLAGEHLINGFRNRDICRRLVHRLSSDPIRRRQLCAKVSRLLGKLRAHGLLTKVRNSYLYRVTARGHRLMSACLEFHDVTFAEGFLQAA